MQNRGSIFFYIITVVIIIIEISVIIFQSLRLSEPSLNTYSEFKEIYTSSRYNYDDKTLRVIAKKIVTQIISEYYYVIQTMKTSIMLLVICLLIDLSAI